VTLKYLVASALFAVAVAGCATSRTETAGGAPLARQITASDHCGLTAPGLVYLRDASAVNALERLPARTMTLAALRSVDFSREHLVLVGLGQQRSGGYGVALAASEITSDTLRLTVQVRRPAPGAMVSQALTTPCAVIAVSPHGWDELEVSGEGMTTLTRQRSEL